MKNEKLKVGKVYTFTINLCVDGFSNPGTLDAMFEGKCYVRDGNGQELEGVLLTDSKAYLHMMPAKYIIDYKMIG